MPPCIDGAGELRLDLFCGHHLPYPAFSLLLNSIFYHRRRRLSVTGEGCCVQREKFDIIAEFKRDVFPMMRW
jgi:hypothetical protein